MGKLYYFFFDLIVTLYIHDIDRLSLIFYFSYTDVKGQRCSPPHTPEDVVVGFLRIESFLLSHCVSCLHRMSFGEVRVRFWDTVNGDSPSARSRTDTLLRLKPSQ
jgi:hypothetical protein